MCLLHLYYDKSIPPGLVPSYRDVTCDLLESIRSNNWYQRRLKRRLRHEDNLLFYNDNFNNEELRKGRILEATLVEEWRI